MLELLEASQSHVHRALLVSYPLLQLTLSVQRERGGAHRHGAQRAQHVNHIIYRDSRRLLVVLLLLLLVVNLLRPKLTLGHVTHVELLDGYLVTDVTLPSAVTILFLLLLKMILLIVLLV